MSTVEVESSPLVVAINKWIRNGHGYDDELDRPTAQEILDVWDKLHLGYKKIDGIPWWQKRGKDELSKERKGWTIKGEERMNYQCKNKLANITLNIDQFLEVEQYAYKEIKSSTSAYAYEIERSW